MNRNRRLNLLIGSAIGAVFFIILLASVFPTTASTTTANEESEPYFTGEQVHPSGDGTHKLEGNDSFSDTLTENATPESMVLLPILLLQPTPTPTATPTPLPQSTLHNGNFEQGHVAWSEYSSNGWQLILRDFDLLVPPHNGIWAAWLGGDTYEDSILSQQIYLAPGDTMLHYWHWIASEDVCNPEYDIAGVLINDTTVDAFLLCEAENTNGWRLRNVDLSAYGGQSVTLHLAAFTDGSLNSNLFLDDVSLGNTAQAAPGLTLEISNSTMVKQALMGLDETGQDAPELYRDYRAALNEFITTNDGYLPVEKN